MLIQLDEQTYIYKGTKITTSADMPPIGYRGVDWSAITEDYDVDYDDDRGGWYSNSPRGFGPTEDAALADLIDQLDEV